MAHSKAPPRGGGVIDGHRQTRLPFLCFLELPSAARRRFFLQELVARTLFERWRKSLNNFGFALGDVMWGQNWRCRAVSTMWPVFGWLPQKGCRSRLAVPRVRVGVLERALRSWIRESRRKAKWRALQRLRTCLDIGTVLEQHPGVLRIGWGYLLP
jgi:hypothetical protein